MNKTITEITAWICTETDGTEGIPAVLTSGIWMPLIGADAERIEALRQHAVDVAKKQGVKLKLVRFSNMEVIEVLDEL